MSLSATKSLQRGGRRDSTPMETVIYQTVEYHISDPKGMKPDSKSDYIVGRLMRNALGLVAEFDENNNPLTEVKIMLRDAPEQTGTFKRPEVLDIKKGKGTSKAMPVNSVGAAESCFLKNGVIQARWLSRHYPEYNPTFHFPLYGVMASVRPQGKRETDDGVKYYQNRYVMAVEGARAFTGGVEGFKAAAIEAMRYITEDLQYPGVPGFVLRAAETDTGVAASKEFLRGYDREKQAPISAEETVERFLNPSPDDDFTNALLGNLAEEAPNAYWEVIPMVRIDTGLFSLPASRVDNARSNGKEVSDTDLHRYTDASDYAYASDDRTEYAFVESDVQVERKPGDDGINHGKWYSTGTKPTKNKGLKFAQAEVLTPELPPELVTLFMENAAARASQTPGKAPAPETADQSFGDDSRAPGI